MENSKGMMNKQEQKIIGFPFPTPYRVIMLLALQGREGKHQENI